MHTEPRNGASIDRIYLHLNEGTQGPGAAFNLHQYLQRIDAGYHVIVDDKTTVICAGDQQVVWAEGGDNQHALSICMIGFSATTDWTTAYSRAMVERAAHQVAHWCKVYNIPAVHVRPGAPGQAPTDRGIAEHADDHDPASEGHADPGARFPIDAFVARVQDIIKPPVDWNKLAELAAWAQRVSAHPLRAGDNSPDVTTAKQLLAQAGFDVGNTMPGYGPAFAVEVGRFKAAHGIAPADGGALGARVVQALGL